MTGNLLTALVLVVTLCSATLVTHNALAAEIAPEQAKDHVGREVTVKMLVKAAKNRLEKRGLVYLDSDADFASPTNLAVLIKRSAADEMKTAGIDDPAAHFGDKWIRVQGTVVRDEDQTRIFVEKASQIELVKEEK